MSPGPLRLCKKTIWAEHVSGRPFTRDNKLAVVPQRVSICRVLSCSRETYNALTNWLTDARTLASPNIVIILCGNKKDLDADREVTFLEASRFAQENGNWWSLCLFFFSSYSWFILSFVVSSFFSTLSFFLPPWTCAFFFSFCSCRADVPGDQCSDRGECRRGFSKVCSHHPQQDRLRYALFSLLKRCVWVGRFRQIMFACFNFSSLCLWAWRRVDLPFVKTTCLTLFFCLF